MNKLLFILMLALMSCSKSHPTNNAARDIQDVTGSTWEIFKVRKPTDTYYYPVPTFWYFNLNNDGRFTFKLHDAVCDGTYSWTQIDSINALVSFHIQNWNAAPSDTAYSNRLKAVLQGIDSCHYLKRPYIMPIPSWGTDPAMELLFSGNSGEFYVFRF